MALTQLTDVIVPEVFGPYTTNASNATSRLILSGAVAIDTNFSADLLGGGATFNMPSWAPIDGASGYDLPTDDATVSTSVKVTGLNEIASRQFGTKSFAKANFAAALAGANPLDAVSVAVSAYINEARQVALLNQLTGLFDTALTGSDSVVAAEAIAGQSVATQFNSTTFVNALAPFGDMLGEDAIIICHSDVYRKMQLENLITFVSVGEATINMPVYLGHTVVVDDKMGKRAGTTDGIVYETYLVKPGAIRQGNGAFEGLAHADPLQGNGAGTESLIIRDTFGMHISGTSWTGTAAGGVPTLAELATGANYAKVLDTKQIGIARLVTN